MEGKVVHIDEKPDIEYPIEWGYRVIGTDEKTLRVVVDEVVDNREYRLNLSKKSRSGKYTSLDLKVTVDSEEHRDRIFRELKSSSAVKMVI
jgi:putative lipoic acid-binding regulatory protein